MLTVKKKTSRSGVLRDPTSETVSDVTQPFLSTFSSAAANNIKTVKMDLRAQAVVATEIAVSKQLKCTTFLGEWKALQDAV